MKTQVTFIMNKLNIEKYYQRLIFKHDELTTASRTVRPKIWGYVTFEKLMC